MLFALRAVVAFPHAMHELSIAIDLVELACQEISTRGDARVAVIHLRVGALAGVVKEALLFSFEAASTGTAVSGARLQIEDVPVTVWCPVCAARRQLDRLSHRRCPICDGVTPTIVGGDDLELVGFELVE
jgi:hydrogenase nickel incorporation protein HypA/HybF